jgi:hypothetical protein
LNAITKKTILAEFLIISIINLFLFSPSAYCGNGYAKGKIAITFNSDVAEKDAVDFINRFNLGIIRKGGFGLPSLQFNIGSNVDTLINEIQKESIVSSVAKGEKLKIEDREGTVAKIKFKVGTELKEVEGLSLKYRKRKEIIAWRYYRIKLPFIVIRVPAGKEREWIENFSKPELKNVVAKANLIALDL